MTTKLNMLQAIDRKLSGVIATTDRKAQLLRKINATLDHAVRSMDGWITLNGNSGEDESGGSHVFVGKGGQIEKGVSGLKGKKLSDLKGTKKFTKYESNGKTVAKNQEDKDYLDKNYDKERGQGERQFGGVNGKAQAEHEAKRLSEITGIPHEIKHEGKHSMPNYKGKDASDDGTYDLFRAVKSKTDPESEQPAPEAKPTQKVKPHTFMEETDKDGTVKRGLYLQDDGEYKAMTYTQSKSFKTEKGAKDWLEKVSGKPVKTEPKPAEKTQQQTEASQKRIEANKQKRVEKSRIAVNEKTAQQLEASAARRESYPVFKESEDLQNQARKLREGAQAYRDKNKPSEKVSNKS